MDNIIFRNNVKIFGEGEEVLLFVHGYGCDQSMWRFITPSFEKNYKLILLDLVGSGKSDESKYSFKKYDSLEGYSDDIIEICESLDLHNINFIGHSVSAMIGVLASIKKPSIFKNLILIGPSPCYINDDTGYEGGFSRKDIDELVETLDTNYLGWSSAMAPIIMDNPDRPELAEELEQSFCQNNPDIAKHFAKVTFLGDNRNDLKNVTVKTLVLQSSVDAIAGINVGEYVQENIVNSELVILDTIGHCPHLSAPKETIFALKTYLN